ncbi:hypothetical protein LEP1GSC188_4587 [Leptospira weilii serovar Topaz str. LT2116]|uniref:Uncharacterized protein n=1 Tax=Leptospira weilii serovar Topaz str. LT2116 TaxID=1088540 RepID=M3H365_9LEPT|nr:hypothetical protein LEP1GSC188_4587 [Leptospira weilii serovar Topaz str. LT2116]
MSDKFVDFRTIFLLNSYSTDLYIKKYRQLKYKSLFIRSEILETL